MRMQTPAKVNLFLKARGRRADGYHELETLFWPLPRLTDEIEADFSAAPGVEAVCANRPELSGADNLMTKAAAKFAAFTGIEPAWRFVLTKRIPVAAGLGGGSSDGAAVLRLLNEHYRACTPDELAGIAAKLGADVPYFLNPVPAVARGVGEIITPLELERELPLVLVNPRFPVSAKWAYTHLAPGRIGTTPAVGPLLDALDNGTLAEVAGLLHNDLEFALYDKFPLLEELRAKALRHGALRGVVSGSGSTLYFLAPDQSTAFALASHMRRNFAVDVFTPGF